MRANRTVLCFVFLFSNLANASMFGFAEQIANSMFEVKPFEFIIPNKLATVASQHDALKRQREIWDLINRIGIEAQSTTKGDSENRLLELLDDVTEEDDNTPAWFAQKDRMAPVKQVDSSKVPGIRQAPLAHNKPVPLPASQSVTTVDYGNLQLVPASEASETSSTRIRFLIRNVRPGLNLSVAVLQAILVRILGAQYAGTVWEITPSGDNNTSFILVLSTRAPWHVIYNLSGRLSLGVSSFSYARDMSGYIFMRSAHHIYHPISIDIAPDQNLAEVQGPAAPPTFEIMYRLMSHSQVQAGQFPVIIRGIRYQGRLHTFTVSGPNQISWVAEILP